MTTTIVGVDFSGAKADNATWKTEARLQGTTLEITACSRVNRKALTEFLEGVQDSKAVVAMDFPFSVPRAFAEKLSPEAVVMPDLWKAVANIENYDEFDEQRCDFVKYHGEMIRNGDANFGGPFSPLKRVNPDMLPMTFHGMRMLHRLWQSQKGFRVPPLPQDGRNGPTLLETMPGVLLRRFGLPATNYKTKNKTNKGRPEDFREKILYGLQKRFGEFLRINDTERKKCRDNPDCLDSLVAATGASEWAIDKTQFLSPRESVPPSEEFDIAVLEGWIYAPLPSLPN